jgi:hypothetical protein
MKRVTRYAKNVSDPWLYEEAEMAGLSLAPGFQIVKILNL